MIAELVSPTDAEIQAAKQLSGEVLAIDGAVDDETNLYNFEGFSEFWRLWREKPIQVVSDLEEQQGVSLDSFAELQFYVGRTTLVSNVKIFHTDMANAEFLDNSLDHQVHNSHDTTREIFEIASSARSEGFIVFAQGRSSKDINRRILALADHNPPETIRVLDESTVEGRVVYPGNLATGTYLFGTDGDPDDVLANNWVDWQQAMPWFFVDLSEVLHRAPSIGDMRSLLIRLSIYTAPARKSKPVSIVSPLIRRF